MLKWEEILNEISKSLQDLFKDNWNGEFTECPVCEKSFPNHNLFIVKYNKKHCCRECKGMKVIPVYMNVIFEESISIESKYCSKCEKILSRQLFGPSKKTKDGLRSSCNDCRSKTEYKANKESILEKREIYYSENRDVILKDMKMYRANNKEKIRKRQKEYYRENREYVIEKSKQYHYWRLENDLEFKIFQRCRSRLYNAVKGYSKSARTHELIGCSIEYLLEHLENQFRDGMTWDNYGDWHIDHIKPCALFDFENEADQRECFNYRNLQPLWAEENYRKSDKY